VQLLRQAEAKSQKHLAAMDNAIGSIQREMSSIQELMGAIDRIKQSEDDCQLVRSFRVLHSSASDVISQHQQQLQQQVVTAVLLLLIT